MKPAWKTKMGGRVSMSKFAKGSMSQHGASMAKASMSGRVANVQNRRGQQKPTWSQHGQPTSHMVAGRASCAPEPQCRFCLLKPHSTTVGEPSRFVSILDIICFCSDLSKFKTKKHEISEFHISFFLTISEFSKFHFCRT